MTGVQTCALPICQTALPVPIHQHQIREIVFNGVPHPKESQQTEGRVLTGSSRLCLVLIELIEHISASNRTRRRLGWHIGEITESSLTKQLRELEADGFLTRYDYKEVPPRVEYNLTDLGKSFIPVFEHMKQWGDENLNI